MKIKPIYEFLLWDNCNNNCSFCHQRKDPRIFNKTSQKEILDATLSFIDSEKFIHNSHVLICGGEIFDNPRIHKFLTAFLDDIIERMKAGIIDLLYINTNLIYKDISCLYQFLQSIAKNKLFTRLKFTTSYDLEGRFKTKACEDLMLSNIIQLNASFPEIKIVTNIIMTKTTCEAILENNLSILDFTHKYKCMVNLIPYIVLNDILTPSRGQIFKALKKVDSEIPNYLKNYIYNITLEQEKKLYVYRNNEFDFCSCEIATCGHSVNFKRYSSNNTCFCCDLLEVFNGVF